MDKMILTEIVHSTGLEMVETTTGMNGYPQDLGVALIGFDDFAQAEKLAKEYGMRITTLHKRDGWHLWERNNDATWYPIKKSASDYGDDYNDYCGGDVASFFECEKGALERDFDSLEELEELVKNWREIADEIENASEDELVITCEGRYYKTIQKESMRWSHDTHTYEIAVIFEDEQKFTYKGYNSNTDFFLHGHLVTSIEHTGNDANAYADENGKITDNAISEWVQDIIDEIEEESGFKIKNYNEIDSYLTNILERYVNE